MIKKDIRYCNTLVSRFLQRIKIQSGTFYSFSAVWDYFFSRNQRPCIMIGIFFGKISRKGLPFSHVLLWALGFCNLQSYEMGFKGSFWALRDLIFLKVWVFSKNVSDIPAAEQRPCEKFVLFALKFYACENFF